MSLERFSANFEGSNQNPIPAVENDQKIGQASPLENQYPLDSPLPTKAQIKCIVGYHEKGKLTFEEFREVLVNIDKVTETVVIGNVKSS